MQQNSVFSRSSAASVTRSATRCGACCCRRSAAPAVWGFRIDGVLHEHQTIPGVVEDVHQIIGNLKNLTLSLDEDKEDAILRITKTESGAVTAADIEDRAGVTILNREHHLFTLQDDRDINVELYVNKGRGYVEADQHPSTRACRSTSFASTRSTTRFAAPTSPSPRRALDSAPTTIASR